MPAIVGIDDTDSRTRGMCTTYLASLLAARLADRNATVEESLLVRLAPGVEYKTRGNAAVALVTDAAPATVFDCACQLVENHAVVAEDTTQPGVVVTPHGPDAIPDQVARFAREAMHRECSLSRASSLVDTHEYRSTGWNGGRGRLGALAAVGADAAVSDWTYERIGYRPPERWGTERDVDSASVFDTATTHYPAIWDTVDRTEETAVCVPRTPGPVLFGIRGDEPTAVVSAAESIEHEPLERACTFRTNQGTDAHLRDGRIGTLQTGRGYRVDGVLAGAPETRAGGHVFFTMAAPADTDPCLSGGNQPVQSVQLSDETTVDCVAFEPTKRFRDRVRKLRVGDQITACGEFSDGTLKLEKFAVRDLVESEQVVPSCAECDRSMESAGADQGYRCRTCSQTAPEKETVRLDRTLECGWYEVPPCARRHVAKPLVRGGFDSPVHPER